MRYPLSSKNTRGVGIPCSLKYYMKSNSREIRSSPLPRFEYIRRTNGPLLVRITAVVFFVPLGGY